MKRLSAFPFQSRRRQLVAGLALAPWVPGVQAAAGAMGGRTAQARRLVVQQSGQSVSAAFAARVRLSGAAVLAFKDLGALLYGDLPTFWGRLDGVLAGLTDVDAFFCIERVALDHGWRAVHLELTPHADAAWVVRQAQALSDGAARVHREHPAAASWSRGDGARWVAWTMMPRERLA